MKVILRKVTSLLAQLEVRVADFENKHVFVRVHPVCLSANTRGGMIFTIYTCAFLQLMLH